MSKQGGHRGRGAQSRGALARSKSIDQQIEDEREKRQKEIQLLILGGASSGKSTFIKQLRIHQGDGIPDSERVRLKPYIFENLMDALNVCIDNMSSLGIEYEHDKNQESSKNLQKLFPKCNRYYINTNDPTSVTTSPMISRASKDQPHPAPNMPDYEHICIHAPEMTSVWRDKGLQSCYDNRGKQPKTLVKAEEYFLKHFDRVLSADYIPTLQDVVYIRRPTIGVQEHSFNINGLRYRVIDVAGQKSQRKKWIHFFDGVTAVMFFVALSGFCEKLEEDQTINSLQDSLHTFSQVIKNQFLEKTDFMLFLNKRDVLEEYLETRKLTECFPQYKGGNSPDAVISHVKELFMREKRAKMNIYTHVTCAVNIEMMKKITSDIMQIIVEINLRKSQSF